MDHGAQDNIRTVVKGVLRSKWSYIYVAQARDEIGISGAVNIVINHGGTREGEKFL